MRRRDFLRAGGLATALAAGCLDDIQGHPTEEATETPTETPTATSTPIETPGTLSEDATLSGWPMRGANPAQTSAVTDDPPSLSDPSTRWEYETPSTPSSPPVVAGDIVCVGSGSRLLGLTRDTGKLIWKTKFEGTISSEPAVHNGTVFVGSGSSEFVALDARTGEKQWEYEFEKVNRLRDGFTVFTPAVAGDTVIFYIAGQGKTIHAVDVADGTPKWRKDPAYSGMTPIIHGDQIHVANGVMDLESGSTVMEYELNDADPIYTPAVTDDAVYIVYDWVRLARFSLGEPTPDWDVEIPKPASSSPVVAGDTVHVSGVGFDVETGEKQFEVPTDIATVSATAGDLALMPRRGSLVSFDPADGTVKWDIDDKDYRTPTCIDEEGAYIRTNSSIIALQ